MRTTVRVFLGSAAFLFVEAAIYWYVTDREWAGRLLLTGSGLAALIVAGYAWMRVRREDTPEPEDRPDADPGDGEGETIAVFTADSPWPLVFGLGVAVFAGGLVFGWPLLIVGAIVVVIAAIGMIRESVT